MGQSPSDDKSSSCGQEIIHHLGNAMNHSIVHKTLRWTLALDICFQSIPDNLICLIYIYIFFFKMVLLSTPRSCKCYLHFFDQII
jgi:hypothetical protein